MANKKLRFEIFKRDNFICQYCGRTPPAVVLELDHVIPKSKGGSDDINNFVTACFDCNRGKGKQSLNSLPDSLSDNLKIAKERLKQLKAYNRFIERQEEQYDLDIQSINQIFMHTFPNQIPTNQFNKASIGRFLRLLPTKKIEDAMIIACSTIPDNPDRALKYFCGICWNWIKKPETRNW